ncbi:MAG: nitroreductase family protein [Coriobacteriia bacterium]|nr:nitroreductase family protein [Coriobacteriia bacterium]
MDTIEAILTRRSIRAYTEEPVADSDLEAILHAAMAAPSAGNQQPWHFVVTDDRERLAKWAETTQYGSMLLKAPLAIAICADTRDMRYSMMWQQDCSAAVENALLAIHALGLGAVWLGFWPKMERVEPLRAVLDLPEGVEPLCVIAVGHPDEHKPSVDRYQADRVHRNLW